jgi:hypothetical protein
MQKLKAKGQQPNSQNKFKISSYEKCNSIRNREPYVVRWSGPET